MGTDHMRYLVIRNRTQKKIIYNLFLETLADSYGENTRWMGPNTEPAVRRNHVFCLANWREKNLDKGMFANMGRGPYPYTVRVDHTDHRLCAEWRPNFGSTVIYGKWFFSPILGGTGLLSGYVFSFEDERDAILYMLNK